MPLEGSASPGPQPAVLSPYSVSLRQLLLLNPLIHFTFLEVYRANIIVRGMGNAEVGLLWREHTSYPQPWPGITQTLSCQPDSKASSPVASFVGSLQSLTSGLVGQLSLPCID